MAGGDTGRVGTGDSPVERLIDQGLERYGKGDLDGALLAWENALSLAPEDSRAVGYVDYVRAHYLLLRGGGGAEAASELAVPFGLETLEDDAAYEIEITETRRARVEAFIDQVDDGWYLDGDAEGVALPSLARPLPLPAEPELAPPPVTFEMEADEPPAGATSLNDDDAGPLAFAPWGGHSAKPRPVSAAGPGDDEQTQDFNPARLADLGFDTGGADGDPDGDDFAAGAETRDFAAHMQRAASAELTAEHDKGASNVKSGTGSGTESGSGSKSGSGSGSGSGDRSQDGSREGDFDYDGGAADETAELKSRHLGFVKLGAESADPVTQAQPGSGFAGPEVSTAEIRVRFKKETPVGGVPAPARPSLDPAAATPDPAADMDLPEPPRDPQASRRPKTLDLGPPGAFDLGNAQPVPPIVRPTTPFARAPSSPPIGPEDDDTEDRTQERGQWTRARSPRAGSVTGAGSALDHLDLDEGGSPSIAPPVIIDDPVMSEPSAFDPVHRSMPTREIPKVTKPQTTTRDFPPVATGGPTREFAPMATGARTIPRVARMPAPPAPTLPPAALLAEIDAGAPAGESPDDRTRRRINALLDRAASAARDGGHPEAVAACDLALAEAPDSAVAQKLVHRSRDAIIAIYQGFLGNLGSRPSLAVPMHELPREQIDSRAAFLLSRIDGNLNFEEILDVSGMTRLEALRHLARMVQRGILAVR